MMLPVFVSSVAVAAPSVEQLADALSTCRGARHELPSLDPGQLQELREGHVVKLMHRRADAIDRAVGFVLVPAPRAHAWLASQDPDGVVNDDVVEWEVAPPDAGLALWYGHLDMPWPFTDRQWVVRSGDNHALRHASSNACWEHHWDQDLSAVDQVRPRAGLRRAITRDDLERSVWMPVNQGSWFFVEVDSNHAIVSFASSVSIGGWVPERTALAFAKGQLRNMLTGVRDRATSGLANHYVRDHEIMAGPDGAFIPLLPDTRPHP